MQYGASLGIGRFAPAHDLFQRAETSKTDVAIVETTVAHTRRGDVIVFRFIHVFYRMKSQMVRAKPTITTKMRSILSGSL